MTYLSEHPSHVFPTMPQPCIRCSKSHSTPLAFLLSCSGECNKSWHHRTSNPSLLLVSHFSPGCHQPPVSDTELIARIRAFNEGDIENSIHGWMCRRCTKRRDSSKKLSTAKLQHSAPAMTSAHPVEPMTNLYVRYNLSPSWIHSRHPDVQNKPLPRPARRRPPKSLAVASDLANVAARGLYNFSGVSWLRERRESATLGTS